MGISQHPLYDRHNVVEFRTNQLKPFKQLFDSIKNKLPDTSILFSSSEMKILQLDGAQTFLVDVRLHGDNFEHFYCNPSGESEMIDINLSANHLNRVFKCVTNGDNLFIFTYAHGSDVVTIRFENEKKSEIRTFQIPIQNPDDDIRLGQIEDLDSYQYTCTMPSVDLVRICKELKNMECEKVQITHDGEQLQFINNPGAKSNGGVKTSIIRQATTTNVEGEMTTVFNKIPEEPSLYSDTFKFSTLYDFSKSQSGGENKIVMIYLKTGEAMVLHYEIGTLGDMNIALAEYNDPVFE